MKLKRLLEGLDYELLALDGRKLDEQEQETALNRDILSITNDSRKVEPKSLFFAISGARSDGHAFAGKAVSLGAIALVVEHPIHWEEIREKDEIRKINDLDDTNEINGEDLKHLPIQVLVSSSRHAMAMISAAFYGYPARRMKMIGITGTKGKTTTTYLIRSILQKAGMDVGLIGTIEMTYHDIHRAAANTTPESLDLAKDLKEMADAGVQVVVMEVSSQALKLQRTAGIVYDIAVFTNLSEDHIGPNEHKDFDEYLQCKSLLFRQCRLAIVNGEDPYTNRILEGSSCLVERYGMSSFDDLYAEHLELVNRPGELGVRFDVKGKTEIPQCEVATPGRFSVYNALAALLVCLHFDVTKEEMRDSLLHASTKGRIELIKVSDTFTLMIDYAHNAVALESLLTTLREYHPNRLVTVFGCGGNRSKTRRYEMGEVSGRLSDFTIITSDNPRWEEPMDIIADIITGISKTKGTYVTIPDRKEAIAYAIHHGQPGDIIVLAGKGHEDYQEIKGIKYPMDERKLIQEILEEDQHKKEETHEKTV